MTAAPQWLTRAEARDYLRYKRVQTVDAKLVESEKYVPGRIRFRRIANEVRLWREDTLKLLTPFE